MTEQTYTDIAVLFATDEIIAVGNGFAEVVKNADATGLWDKAPGSHAPYYYTTKEAKDNFGCWFAPGFWAKHNEGKK